MRNTIRIGEAFSRYQAEMRARRRSADTLRSDRSVVGMFIRATGDVQMASLTPKHVKTFFYGKNGIMNEHRYRGDPTTYAPVSEATHNQYRARLKAFFKWCREEGIPAHPGLLKDVERMDVPEKKRYRPDANVMLDLLDTADNDRDRCLLAVSMNSALRSKSIRMITVGDVDLDAGYIDVQITKTKSVDRMPISADLDVELRRWLTTYANDIERPLRGIDYLFPTRGGGMVVGKDKEGKPRLTPRYWKPEIAMARTERIVKRGLEALGREDTLGEGTHTIRRGVALAYFRSLCDDKKLNDNDAMRQTQALLGHKNMATTERYLGLDIEKHRRDERMRGKPFLSGMVDRQNVVQLRPTATGE